MAATVISFSHSISENRGHLYNFPAVNGNYLIPLSLNFPKYGRCSILPSILASHSSSSSTSSASPSTLLQTPLQTRRFLTNKELENFDLLGSFSYHQELESGFLWIRVMRDEEMDMTATLLSESFAESMMIVKGYAKLLKFLVKNYLIERRGMMPHAATLIGIYRENGEEDFELTGTVELTFGKKGANATPYTHSSHEFPIYLQHGCYQSSSEKRYWMASVESCGRTYFRIEFCERGILALQNN